MKKLPTSKRQLKKLEKQYRDGSIAKMANAKIRDRLLAKAKGLFGE